MAGVHLMQPRPQMLSGTGLRLTVSPGRTVPEGGVGWCMWVGAAEGPGPGSPACSQG